MNNELVLENNNHIKDLNTNNLINSNRIIFDSQSLRNHDNCESNRGHIILHRNSNNNNINSSIIRSNTDRINNIFHNFDRNSNNLINISINDELSSRLNNINFNSNDLRFSSNSLNLTDRNSNNHNLRIDCQACRMSFANERDFEGHLSSCRDFRNNRMMHNINEILQLVQSLNRHIHNEGRFNSLSLFGLDEPEDIFDFIDWVYVKKSNIWKNEGKINITSKIKLIIKI